MNQNCVPGSLIALSGVQTFMIMEIKCWIPARASLGWEDKNAL